MANGWTLEPNAEREVLLPWLERQDDRTSRAVWHYLAELVANPWRPHLEDDETGVFSAQNVAGTGVSIVWVLDDERHQVVLVSID